MPYLLPCECGRKLSIQRSQAGSFVQCSECGGKLDVPTLVGLSKLEWQDETPQAERQTKAAPRWNPLRGTIAAICLVIALVGLTRAGLYGIYRWGHPTNFTVEEMLANYDQAVAKMTPAETWDSWCYVQERGLTDKNPPTAFVMKQNLEALDPWMIGWATVGGLAALGLVLTTLRRGAV